MSPEPERERSAWCTMPYWGRRDLLRGRGRLPFRSRDRRRGSSGGVGFELVLDPVVPQMAEQLVEVVAPAPAVFQASSPAVEYFAPAPAVFQVSSLVVEYVASALSGVQLD